MVDRHCGDVQVGDVLVGVDSVTVEQYPLDAVKTLTIGPEGSSVTLRMQRGSEPYTVTLQRILPNAPTL